MPTTLRIEELPGETAAIALPAGAGGDGCGGRVTVEFGAGQAAARLLPAASAPAGCVGLSPDLIRRLRIPAAGRYRLRAVAPGRVRIGPVIGILAAATPAELAPRLGALANHLLAEAGNGGLFLAFDRTALDPGAGVVAGYRYAGGEPPRWEPGLFPLPPVIFRRYGVGPGDQRRRLQALGVQVFNERTFSKWECWRWLSRARPLRPHLPETARLQGPESVLQMLGRFPAVFIKPAWGSLGARILRVRREGAGFLVEGGPVAGGPEGAGPIRCPDAASLAAALAGRLPRPGIVQQGLDLAAAAGRLVDFRVVLQKDGRGRWSVPAVVGRCGPAGRIVSNMAAGGFPLPAASALGLLFGHDPITVFRRRQELAELALAAGAALDRSGLLLGDLGLDLAYDRGGHPWIIEVNNRDPDHNIAWEAGDWPLFFRLRTQPLAYACFLAGFGEVDHH